MRTFLVALFLIIFFIVSIPLYLILLIIDRFDEDLRARIAQNIVSLACKIILFLSGVKLTVIGADNIPKDGGVLFIFNHRSYFDILVIYSSTSKLASFIGKKALKYFPFINVWMMAINCLFIDRDDLKQNMKIILKAIDMVKNGYSIFIAPEGTRNHEKELLPFKDGSFKIAQKSNCPIVTISINNTDNIFENHEPIIKKGHVILEYGKPFYYSDLSKDDQKRIGKYTRDIIQKTIDKNEANLEF